MAFRIKRKEATAQAVRRVTHECLAKALGELSQSGSLEAIHAVRKEIKKLRAILRLVRDSIDRGSYCKASKALREAARHLGPARDAHVTLRAIKDLIDRFRGELPPRPFGHLVQALRLRCLKEEKRFRKQNASIRAARNLKKASRRLKRISLREKGWPALGAGLSRSYRSGRKAYRRVVARTTPENLHEWRKRVKDLWYQLRLLCGIWPEELETRAKELKALSDYLGDDHDLVMLKDTVEELSSRHGQANELKTLCGLAERCQGKLRRKAMAVGARFYLEKPADFCQRLAGYWVLWRKRK